MAILLKASGACCTITERLDLKTMQELVGGYIEIVQTNDGRLMVLDEEGKLKGKPINIEATGLTRGIVSDDDFIVGDVIIASTTEID